MAVLTFFQPQNMFSPFIWVGKVTSFSSSTIVLEAGANKGIYYGSFRFGATDISGGTVSGYDEIYNGTTQYSVRNASLSAITTDSYLDRGDAVGLQRFALALADTIYGSNRDDQIRSWAGNDSIYSGEGNDLIDGGDGSDYADGGDGDDTYVLQSTIESYQISYNATSGILALKHASTGTENLKNIEYLTFSNRTVPTLAYSDLAAPTITGFSPGNLANAVPVSSNISIEFSENIYIGSGEIAIQTSSGQLVEKLSFGMPEGLSISGKTLTINPKSDLSPGTIYEIVIGADAIRDSIGNRIAETHGYSFTTESGPNILGTTGNDTLFGGAGKLIDGLASIDTVTYSGNRGSVVYNTNGTWTVGTDTLTNIERLQFADKRVALDITDNALETLQFIGIIAPSLQSNLSIRGAILSLFDQGKSMQEMSQLALDLGLLTSDNTTLAKTVFKNVLNATEEPDQNLTSLLVSFIEQNGDAKFLASVAGMSINVDLVGLQQNGMEYLL